MTRFLSRRVLALAAACAASAVLITAAAKAEAPASDAVTTTVSTHGLDLSLAADRKQLDHRVHVAVRQLCGDAGPEELGRAALIEACREIAFRSAAPQVDALVRRDVQYAALRTAARNAG
jgi:UrcA family protein